MLGKDAAVELQLFIQNDERLYRGKYLPITKNLVRKMARGVYDHDIAPKLWMYLVDAAAKAYSWGPSNGSAPWHKVFDIATRQHVAQTLADEWLDDAQG